MGKGWEVLSKDLHTGKLMVVVVPKDDIQEHDEFNPGCECDPEMEICDNGTMLLTHNAFDITEVAEWLIEQKEERQNKGHGNAKFRKKPVVIDAVRIDRKIQIITLEGTMTGEVGDWLITGVNGEKYPCKDDVFQKTYDPVEDT